MQIFIEAYNNDHEWNDDTTKVEVRKSEAYNNDFVVVDDRVYKKSDLIKAISIIS